MTAFDRLLQEYQRRVDMASAAEMITLTNEMLNIINYGR
ncbi:hypothetical protein FHT21_000734 [Pedobacter sp. SG908]|nr:hypothetical protein [Pedobacter sp. SG908]NMN35693.1 hypothetical protein [Pedobacter sp. SG918]